MVKSQIRTLAYSFAWLTAATAATASEPESAKNLSLTLKFACSVSYHSYTDLRYDDFMKTEQFIENDYYVKKDEKIQLTISHSFVLSFPDNRSQYYVKAKRYGSESSFNVLEQKHKRSFQKSSFMSEIDYRGNSNGEGYTIRYNGFYDLEVEVDPEFFGINGYDDGLFDHHTYFKKQSNNRWRGSISSSYKSFSSHIILDCLVNETDVSYEKWMFKSQLWLEKLPTESSSE